MTEVSHWSTENVTEELLVHLHRVLLRDCSLNPQSIWEKLAVRGVMFWKLHAYLPNSKMNNISKKYFYLTFTTTRHSLYRCREEKTEVWLSYNAYGLMGYLTTLQ